MLQKAVVQNRLEFVSTQFGKATVGATMEIIMQDVITMVEIVVELMFVRIIANFVNVWILISVEMCEF